MAADERARHELHRKLDEVLGPQEAATLMAHLPPVGWADVATKQDLAQLEERLSLRFQSQLDRLRVELVDKMADFAATYVRSTVIAVTGSVLTATGLVFAARLV